MSRPIVLGNGNILLCFDKNAQIRDFYYPYVGLENHIGTGRVHKVGVRVDDKFSWLSDDGWEFNLDYQEETLASKITALNKNLELRLNFNDLVYNEKNILIRNVKVENLSERNRGVKVFFNQQFQISQTNHADTAYYNPSVNALIHYKGRRVFLIGGRVDNRLFDEYSTGLFGIEGKDGTWKDAEDGQLSRNPIEHGSVDSTLGFDLDMGGNSSKDVVCWTTVGETFKEVQDLQEYIISKTPAHITKSTEDFWKAWVNKTEFTFHNLDKKVVDLFKKSLLIIRTHCDNNGGILASGDSGDLQYGRDTYGYVWPRDGAFVSMALDRAGYTDISRRFYDFFSSIVTDPGYLLHKYQPDRSLGSSWHPWIKDDNKQLAIQEDETAILLIGLWEHYKVTKDLEFIENIYNSFIKKAGDFLHNFIDSTTGLPLPSYDLWEERYGISTFTSSSVYGALVSAGNFAYLLGKEDDKKKYLDKAEDVKQAVIKHLYSEKDKYFYKDVLVENGAVKANMIFDSSSFFGIFRFGLLLPSDPILINSYSTIKEALLNNAGTGGIIRYKGDQYFQGHDEKENPWFITSLWLIQYDIARAESEKELMDANKELSWVVERALTSGVLSEQINPRTGEQLSVAPLTWSHAEFVATVMDYMEKIERMGIRKMSFPIVEY